MGLFFRGASEVCRGLLVGHWGGKSQHELDKPWILTNFLLSSIFCYYSRICVSNHSCQTWKEIKQNYPGPFLVATGQK